jgi:hypothetical protein
MRAILSNLSSLTPGKNLKEQARSDISAGYQIHEIIPIVSEFSTCNQSAGIESYDRIQNSNESAREGMRIVAEKALLSKKSTIVFVKIVLEGNAPSTIAAVGGRI